MHSTVLVLMIYFRARESNISQRMSTDFANYGSLAKWFIVIVQSIKNNNFCNKWIEHGALRYFATEKSLHVLEIFSQASWTFLNELIDAKGNHNI